MQYRYSWGDRDYAVNLERVGAEYRATIEGRVYPLMVLEVQPGQISLLLAGRPVTLFYAQDGERRWISVQGCTYLLEKPAPRGARRMGGSSLAGRLRAPMPAQVRSVEVAEGDQVVIGQTLVLLEAMKMEIRVKAPRAGRVIKILVDRGQTVDRDQALIDLDD